MANGMIRDLALFRAIVLICRNRWLPLFFFVLLLRQGHAF
jgi:hypothetical protein